jgi:hypothetical protein
LTFDIIIWVLCVIFIGNGRKWFDFEYDTSLLKLFCMLRTCLLFSMAFWYTWILQLTLGLEPSTSSREKEQWRLFWFPLQMCWNGISCNNRKQNSHNGEDKVKNCHICGNQVFPQTHGNYLGFEHWCLGFTLHYSQNKLI